MTYRCPDSHIHGRTVTCHKTHGCRCAACCARAARHHQELKAKKRAGFVGFVPIDPTRDHILVLTGAGMTQKHIASRSGISEVTITRIVQRRQNIIHSNTARALLAVPILESVQAGGGVDGLGTRRRLGALMSLGYTGYFLSGQLGTYQGYVSDALHRDQISHRYRDAVADLYERLSMTTPPETPAAKRARLFAARLGHVPPLMWNDIDTDPEPPTVETLDEPYIDDVAVARALTGEPVKLTRPERVEATRIAHARHWSDSLIAARLRVDGKTVAVMRGELGLLAWSHDEAINRTETAA